MRQILLSVIIFMGFAFSIRAQDDLLKRLEQETGPLEEKAGRTFKGTRLINGHSVELRERGTLDFLISHRFGRINSGAYSFFGLDESNIRFGLEYAISSRFTLGMGRNSFRKVYDGFLKYKVLFQQEGEKTVPISLVWFSSAAINTLKRPELPMDFGRRLGFTHQVLLSRKFNNVFSAQITPTFIHRNMVSTRLEENDLFALGLGGSYKITSGTSLNLEYYYRLGEQPGNTYDALAIGFDIETGGHVFQLHLTNAQSMTETGFIPATTGDFFGGDIHFGFNISRTFQLKEKGERW